MIRSTDRTSDVILKVNSEIFKGKWRLYILEELSKGPVRLGQLSRRIPKASKKVLIENLKMLEDSGIILRTDLSRKVLHIEYCLAPSLKHVTCDVLAAVKHWQEVYRLTQDSSRRDVAPPF